MGGSENQSEKIRSLLMQGRVLSLQWIADHAEINERTAQRHLKSLKALTSYTHKRRFVTLPDIPRFDKHGIWFHRKIGFSRSGNSLEAIADLIEQSKCGLSREELEAILKIGISKQIQILMQRNKLQRVKLGGRYLYMPDTVMKNEKMKVKLLGDRQTEEHFGKEVEKKDLIALLKAILVEKKVEYSLKSIKHLAQKYILKIPAKKIYQLLVKFDLPEKKRPESGG